MKMEDFLCNAIFVEGGHTTESLRIVLTFDALNDLDVEMADIENAYLTAPINEKVWTVLGP
jgi:hypothetical protein